MWLHVVDSGTQQAHLGVVLDVTIVAVLLGLWIWMPDYSYPTTGLCGCSNRKLHFLSAERVEILSWKGPMVMMFFATMETSATTNGQSPW